jgi:hypothetical protein
MTNTTPPGQVPEALRLADELEIPIEGYPEATELEHNAAAELRRLHAYCQELESQVIRDCMTHVQNPAEIEHVAGDVSKNGAESNMGAAYAEAPDERDDFEKVFPLPSGCIRVGTGYASTGYSNWAAHTHCERWKGWKARASSAQAPAGATFQQRVHPWLLECFGAEIAADRVERNHRFLEEAIELVQSLGCTASEAHQLVDYVFGRPVGDPPQEVGGVMVTLAALCLASGLDMHDAGEVELARISAPEVVAKIRAKQAAKPKHSPLPEAPTAQAADSVLEDAARWRELREQHESDEALCCVFAPDDMRECLVPVGSLPGELDAFMDSESAARKQGANHD